MSIKDFCAYSGFSRYQFMRLADKAGIHIKAISADMRSRMVDVQEALRALENLPEADKEVPINLPETSSTVPDTAT
ncbi:MAG: hypothetical protein C5B54_04170 [Acidobacteria bacterium]|nr:MAG: hypothetical protein C5B54_04170 [Acidobacteriota bacterium]